MCNKEKQASFIAPGTKKSQVRLCECNCGSSSKMLAINYAEAPVKILHWLRNILPSCWKLSMQPLYGFAKWNIMKPLSITCYRKPSLYYMSTWGWRMQQLISRIMFKATTIYKWVLLIYFWSVLKITL